MLFRSLFPDLPDGVWTQVDFNALAMRDFPVNATNPLLNADFCEAWEKEIFQARQATYGYGGYGENRAILWRDHYHQQGKTWHLGTDFYVPVGTTVATPVPLQVMTHRVDPEPDGGWGGQVIARIAAGPYTDYGLIFAHLDTPNAEKFLTPSTHLPAHTVLGNLGGHRVNGGWSPHLHLQLVHPNQLKTYTTQAALYALDGYGTADDVSPLRFPDSLVFTLLA